MTHLRIELNTIPENVTSNVIHKLYETAKAIIDAEEANDVQESLVSLKGNLLVSKAYGDEIDWLEAKFPDLHITAGTRYIRFADPAVYARLSLYLGDGTGITSSEITNANIFSSSNDSNTGYPYFRGNTSITSFNELGLLPLVTTTPSAAFRDTSNLTSIDLSNVTSVGDSSFWSSGITSADLSSCTTINNSAFRLCTDLTTVILNPSISTISNWAFSGCTSLILIDLSNVTNVLNSAFENCTSLTSVDLSSCTTIGKEAFKGCTALTTCIWPTSVTTIPDSCFNGCTNLTSVDLSNCTSIGSNAFKGCAALTSVDLSNCTTLAGYPGDTFRNCTNLATVTGLSSISDVGYATFNGCTSLGTNLDLVLNITSNRLSGNTFRKTKFKTVTINGSNLTNIFDVTGSDVYPGVCFMNSCIKMDFSNTKITSVGGLTGCSSIDTVIYPSTVTNIHWDFTVGNSNATYIVLLATTPPVIENMTYFNFANNNCNIYVPDSSLSAYLIADKWSDSILLNRLKGISELPSGVTWVTKQSS